MPQSQPQFNQADIQLLKTIFLTKQEAQKFLTKADAKKFATKDDLRRFATKDDLSRAMDRILNYTNKQFATKEELAEVKQLIKNLPTKEEFFGRMDQLSSEYTTFTQEKTVLMHRFEQLEQKVAAITN